MVGGEIRIRGTTGCYVRGGIYNITGACGGAIFFVLGGAKKNLKKVLTYLDLWCIIET